MAAQTCVSASRISATVVTENRRNFELWRDGLARSGRRLDLYIVERGGRSKSFP